MSEDQASPVRKPSSAEGGKCLTARELCELLGCSPSTLKKRVESGELPKPIFQGRGKKLFSSEAVRRCISPITPSAVVVQPLRVWGFDAKAVEAAHYAGKPRHHARYRAWRQDKEG